LAPFWSYYGTVAVSLSIKDVPDDLAEALRERAARNHRSVQGELMHILEEAVRPRPFKIRELVKELRALRFSSPDESTKWIRRDRDRR
jgi:plasmid stability protein